jgi:hypothetical protein
MTGTATSGKLRSACDSCHRTKVRCSGGVPCETCTIYGNTCFYSYSGRLGRPRGTKNKRVDSSDNNGEREMSQLSENDMEGEKSHESQKSMQSTQIQSTERFTTQANSYQQQQPQQQQQQQQQPQSRQPTPKQNADPFMPNKYGPFSDSSIVDNFTYNEDDDMTFKLPDLNTWDARTINFSAPLSSGELSTTFHTNLTVSLKISQY